MITRLLKTTFTILSPTVTIDSVGGDDIVWHGIGSYPCRIERLSGDRKVALGRMNTEATHILYCNPELYDILEFNQIVQVRDRQYDIVDFEDLVHIIDSEKITHLEVNLKYKEQMVEADEESSSSSSSSEEYSSSSSSIDSSSSSS
jgi:hypothetical protein